MRVNRTGWRQRFVSCSLSFDQQVAAEPLERQVETLHLVLGGGNPQTAPLDVCSPPGGWLQSSVQAPAPLCQQMGQA